MNARRLVRIALLALWLAAGMLIFARTVDRSLNHDEHQFIVPGALLAREGLLPYRDYPLFHLPNLVLVYAVADRLTGDPILGPKLVSFIATWLAAGLLLVISVRALRGSALLHFLAGAGILTLFLFDPLALYTTGKTWNHELPALLLLIAVVFHVGGTRRDSALFLAVSGAACGLAVGTRLTFLPCLIPLFILPFFLPVPARRRLQLAGAFALAATVALGPSLYFLAAHPEPFLFGNLEFPRLRLLDPENTRIRKTMSIWRKLRYFFKEVALPSWPLFIAFIAIAVPALRHRIGAANPTRSGALTVGVTAAFLVIGCFLPSRYQYQHFYALIPLLLLALAFTGREDDQRATRAADLPLLLAVLGTISAFFTITRPVKGNLAFPKMADVVRPEEWFTSEAVRVGAELRSLAPAGKILTLAPSWPIAGGLAIYPEFATGPFAWRSARFVAPERREKFGIVGPDDLPRLLQRTPPGGILTGVEEDDLEAPLVAFARSNGYTPQPLARKRTLWLPPVR